MKKAEAATIFDLTTLLKRVPAVTGVVTSTDVYRKALEDYRFVINQAVRFMEHWTAYSMWKGDPDVDEADLELDKETAEEAFKELKDYIRARAAEGWE